MEFSRHQRTGVALLVVAASSAGGIWYGVDYYRDAAGCDASYRKEYAAVSQVRTVLATEQNDAVNTLLNGVGDLIDHPGKDAGVKYRALFGAYRATTDRIARDRVMHPFPDLPEGCVDA